MGAIPFVYTDYQPVGDQKIRARFADTWGVPAESLSLKSGLMITEVVKPESGIRGMYIMGENPIISDPDIAHAEHWFQGARVSGRAGPFPDGDRAVMPTSSCPDRVSPRIGTFVNTERRIQLSHKALNSPGEARGDLEILMDLTNRLGLPTTFRGAEDVMREITRVTPSWAGVTYDRLEGARAPVSRADRGPSRGPRSSSTKRFRRRTAGPRSWRSSTPTPSSCRMTIIRSS